MSSGPLVLGHRGSPNVIRENTLPSLLRALEEGADGVEFDVLVTRDGVLALHHDTIVHGLPAFQLTFAELQQALRHPVTSLEEVLEAIPEHVFLDVELKRQGSLNEFDVHQRLGRLLRRRRSDRTLVTCFDGWFLRALHGVAPELPKGWIVDSSTFADPWDFRPEAIPFVAAIAVSTDLIDTAIVERAAAAGLWCAVWSADTEEVMERCLRRWPAVGAVITKRPAVAVACKRRLLEGQSSI